MVCELLLGDVLEAQNSADVSVEDFTIAGVVLEQAQVVLAVNAAAVLRPQTALLC